MPGCRRCALTSVCAASYGFSHMSTPHFAKFAASATVFERAYVAVALCMPSRTAILTSRRADTTMDWDVRRAAARSACLLVTAPPLTVAYRRRRSLPSRTSGSAAATPAPPTSAARPAASATSSRCPATSCARATTRSVRTPLHFLPKKSLRACCREGLGRILLTKFVGFAGMGKIFHEGSPSAHQDTANEFNPGDNHSWSPEFFVPAPLADGPGPGIFDAESEASVPPAAETWPTQIPVPPTGYPIVHKFDLEDHELMDGRIAARAVEMLANLSRADMARPFFLAVGLHRPHCPWCEYDCFAMASSPSDPGAAAGRRASEVLGPLPQRVDHAATTPLRAHRCAADRDAGGDDAARLVRQG